MSGVLHPVGPEPTQTYWLRRAVIAGAVIALVVLLVVLLNLNRGATAVPMATPSPVPPSMTPAGSARSPSATPSVSATPSASATSTTSSAPSTKPTTTPTPSGADGRKSTATSTPKATPTPTRTATPDCDPAKLRVTLTGDRTLRVDNRTTFRLSLINGSGLTCLVTVDRDSFELKIYSGTDRIWSSRDCSTAFKAFDKKLAAEQDIGWRMSWDGLRSKKDCKQRPEIPRAGIYWATAQLDGAKPVQLRMTLRA